MNGSCKMRVSVSGIFLLLVLHLGIYPVPMHWPPFTRICKPRIGFLVTFYFLVRASWGGMPMAIGQMARLLFRVLGACLLWSRRNGATLITVNWCLLKGWGVSNGRWAASFPSWWAKAYTHCATGQKYTIFHFVLIKNSLSFIMLFKLPCRRRPSAILTQFSPILMSPAQLQLQCVDAGDVNLAPHTEEKKLVTTIRSVSFNLLSTFANEMEMLTDIWHKYVLPFNHHSVKSYQRGFYADFIDVFVHFSLCTLSILSFSRLHGNHHSCGRSLWFVLLRLANGSPQLLSLNYAQFYKCHGKCRHKYTRLMARAKMVVEGGQRTLNEEHTWALSQDVTAVSINNRSRR